MKTVLATLNAKYIHTSLALRLLYIANKDKHDISFKEYTIKENIEKIADELLASGCKIIGLSVYIWNVLQTEKLVHILKKSNPKLVIILGGPEVMYDPESFLENWNVDYIIGGEGEFILGSLLDILKKGEKPLIDGVSSKSRYSKTIVQADLNRLSVYPSPYQLLDDKELMINRLVYFETSRGCPYQCQYCLSSLEKGVRYYPKEYIFENLSYLIKNGVKLIKFLDRTFNLNKKHTKEVFDYLIANYREGLVCQFEIYADLLDDETIDYLNEKLPVGFFRFEIGIQSTYEPTNEAVKRKQDFSALAHNVKRLMEGGKVDLHLDLIAGLPHESFERFVASFNDVFALGAKEVQLGFLKMLRGTNIRKNADLYSYEFNNSAPYEIKHNADISAAELNRIHEAEHALEKYWNSGRFQLTMSSVFTTSYKGRYFEFFDELGQFYKQNQYSHYGYQLEDLFRILYSFLSSKNIDLFDKLRNDYYNNFTIRPAGFWEDRIDKKTRKKLLYIIGQDKTFLKKHELSRKIIEKQTAIDLLGNNSYLLTIFLNHGNTIERRQLAYTPEEKVL
ncbi:radical SAM protein [Dysgonomonas sp. 216]|uniref:B12-binding domain-containing radical SAM protein n=1 Tax=Dysgonomonas sp. 216 TaxID=2302934 RepID=UPI0013D32CDF|nr:radical SAM protein [Dysgonomonas sp. 216]NDW18471.1 radical SAM protein [Dysgonomonas sp. 216]